MHKSNMTRLILLLCMVLMMAFTLGCGRVFTCRSDTLTDERVFTWQGDTLTDGNASYRFMDDDWYYTGTFKIRIGVWKGRNAIYASDETEWLIKEKESFLQDMRNNPLIRTDVVLPDPADEHNRIKVNNSILSEEAAMQLRAYDIDNHGKLIKKIMDVMPTFVTVIHPEIDELGSNFEGCFVLQEKTLFLGEYRGSYDGFYAYEVIPEESALYREVLEAMK